MAVKMGKASLPSGLLSDFTKAAAGTKVFGVPVEELNLEELVAAIGAIQVQQHSETQMKDRVARFERMALEEENAKLRARVQELERENSRMNPVVVCVFHME